MEREDHVVVYTLNDELQAEIIKNALNAEGIACEIEGGHQAALTGVLEIRILVKLEDEDRARKLIASHEP